MLGDVEHRRCPLYYLDDDIWAFVSAYGHYERGFLPEGGGIADQPGTFLAACSYFAAELRRLRKTDE